jgi:hypothetical protein
MSAAWLGSSCCAATRPLHPGDTSSTLAKQRGLGGEGAVCRNVRSTTASSVLICAHSLMLQRPYLCCRLHRVCSCWAAWCNMLQKQQ